MAKILGIFSIYTYIYIYRPSLAEIHINSTRFYIQVAKKKKMAQASLCGKIKCELDVKISDEEFYNIYSRRMYEMAKISPKIIRSAELLKGQWGEEGSIIYWNYNLGKIYIFNDYILI